MSGRKIENSPELTKMIERGRAFDSITSHLTAEELAEFRRYAMEAETPCERCRCVLMAGKCRDPECGKPISGQAADNTPGSYVKIAV